MPDGLLEAWLRQAHADLNAGRADAGAPCHRRYWLQQACEKGIKALGLILWRGHASEEGQFRHFFLHRHSPLGHLQAEVANAPGAPKSLRLLLGAIEAELNVLDGSGMLARVDATTPMTDLTDVSYRYPFQASSGEVVAPAEWNESDWDAYQGNAAGVIAAVDRFLRVVEARRILSRT